MESVKLKNTPTTQRQAGFIENFLTECRKIFDEEIIDKWLSKLDLISLSESELILSAPSKFIRDWITREFLDKKSHHNIKEIAKLLVPTLKKVAVMYVPSKEIEQEFQPKSSTAVVSISKHDNVFVFGTELNPKFTFDKFISANYNKFALRMAKIVAGMEAQLDLFDDKIPLYIHGGVGLGKTHLAQAIAWHLKEKNKNKKVVYLSAEKFMYHFVQSSKNNDLIGFKEKMRSIDVLIVDDAQFIAGKEATQQEFMNSFNNLVAENKQVVLVCDRSPSDLENIDEKLKSRISGGMIVNFKNPTYQDRFDILQAKLATMSADIVQEVTGEIMDLIVKKISTIRDLEGVLRKLAAKKLFEEEEITLENTKKILSEYVTNSDNTVITLQKISNATAEFFNLKISDLTSTSRARNVVRPRQIAMYLAKNMTSQSLPKIAAQFNKNHATAIHAIELVKQLMISNSELAKQVGDLEEKIRNAKK